MWNMIPEEQEKIVLRQDLVSGKEGFEILPFIGL